MEKTERISDDEFKQMINLLNRYVATDMDQWEMWSFQSSRNKVYISIQLAPEAVATEANYRDLTHLIGA